MQDAYGDYNGAASGPGDVQAGCPVKLDDDPGPDKAQSGVANTPTTLPAATTPGGAGAPSCVDRLAPRTTITRGGMKASASGVTVVGFSRDRDCGGGSRGRVARVQVAISRKVPGGCRYLLPGGSFGGRRTCQRALYLPASARYVPRRGLSTFTFTRRVHLVPGRYIAQARGIDPRGNVEGLRRLQRVAAVSVR